MKPGWERQEELQVLKQWSRLGVKKLLPATEGQRGKKVAETMREQGRGGGILALVPALSAGVMEIWQDMGGKQKRKVMEGNVGRLKGGTQTAVGMLACDREALKYLHLHSLSLD